MTRILMKNFILGGFIMSTMIWFSGNFSNVKEQEIEELRKLIYEFFGNEEQGVFLHYSIQDEKLGLLTRDDYKYGYADENFKSSEVDRFCNEHGIKYQVDLYSYDPVWVDCVRND